MSLADRLNDLVDDVDPRNLPRPDVIRRRGDRLRWQRRARVSAGAVALALVVVLTAITVMAVHRPSGTPAPVGRIGGWRVTWTAQVPGSGGIRYGDHSLWAVDMHDGGLNSAGTAPAGALVQLDPASGQVRDRIPEAVGGWPSLGAGALWLSTAAGGLDVLTRVDLTSHAVSRIPTSRPRQLPHGVAFARGGMWVANYASGDLVRMDPESHDVLRTIHLGDATDGRAPQSVVSDGRTIWTSDDNGLVVRRDGATGRRISQLRLPLHDARLAGIDTSRHLLYAAGVRGTDLFEIHTPRTGADRVGRELHLSSPADAMVSGLATGGDSLWVATLNPDQLLRIDPDSFVVTHRAALHGVDHRSNVPVDLDAGPSTVWVRVRGLVSELSPPG